AGTRGAPAQVRRAHRQKGAEMSGSPSAWWITPLAVALIACSSPTRDESAGHDRGSGGGSTASSSSAATGGLGGAGTDAVPACATDLGPELAKLKVPGLSAGIVKKGQLACTAVAGEANREDHRAVAPETIFAWASVSKTVTATATMILFDEGK